MKKNEEEEKESEMLGNRRVHIYSGKCDLRALIRDTILQRSNIHLLYRSDEPKNKSIPITTKITCILLIDTVDYIPYIGQLEKENSALLGPYFSSCRRVLVFVLPFFCPCGKQNLGFSMNMTFIKCYKFDLEKK